ncbi:hypothetical protein ACFTWS_04825 [Streptomyces sp. NPDC057027]|uniref:hypothetical protein n=1 Tax=Streptomyces sp. NPDC057027 TaxID=3346004 RepID=UPI00364079FB
MGFMSAWAIGGHTDQVITGLFPRLLPAMRADRARPDLDYSKEEESVLDGPLRAWRTAARRGPGLCGVAVHLC